MTEVNSIRQTPAHKAPQRKIEKPRKPSPQFPLSAHPNGQWCKKIRGRLYYFGLWADPDAALNKYLAEKDDLYAGRTPRPVDGAITVRDLCNRFLTFKRHLVDAGELAERSWRDYLETCKRLVEAFGRNRRLDDIRNEDFEKLRTELAGKGWSPVTLVNEITRVRSVFNYAYAAALIDQPMRFGPGFKRPSKKTLRLNKAKQGKKLFTANEIRWMLNGAGAQLRAMILLGINCGFGNADCGRLTVSAVDLEGGWIDYPRPKTGVARRCPLWPETVEAIRAVVAKRKPDNELVFITKRGQSWAKNIPDNPISKETRKLLDKLEINGHRNFYTLRHTFRTVADESKDQPAVDLIMGHARDDMASVYRETISDERLRAVADCVRQWLYPRVEKGGSVRTG
jgi:integrase